MDGKCGTLHERWKERTEAAYRRMFGGKSQQELATLTQREDLAVLIAQELSAFHEYQRGSFGYTGIVEVDPGRLLYVSDRHDRFAEYDGKETTAIQGAYITVKRMD
jgi:hypothetical protein